MTIDDGMLHSKFTLNGISYSASVLRELSYDLIKEGKPFEKSIGNFLSDWLDSKPTLEVKTSGSTGKPKNILLQKTQMVNSALATGEYFDLKEGDTALLCLPVDYIAGKMMLVRAMILGLELDFVDPSSNPLRENSKTYDFGAMVPLQLENSLVEIEKIKTLIVGGAAVSIALKEKTKGKSTAVYETYGMTETITHVAVKRINSVRSSSKSAESQYKNNFEAISNVAFAIDDRGCLIIAAPKVSDKPVITNDMVSLTSATEFELLGRHDNIINSGGVKLFPEQIEAKLAPFLDHRFFVAGLPDDKLGQKLVLIIEGEIDSEIVIRNLVNKCNLERFEIPKNVYSVSSFLETETGKIRRKDILLLINK